MKIFGILLAIVLTFLAPKTVYANAGAPDYSDTATTITFEKNEDIAVTSETLDITVMGDKASIKAAYYMKNTSETAVTTPVMFVSPNIAENGTTVLVNGENIDFNSEHFYCRVDHPVRLEDWQFYVLTKNDPNESNFEVDTVNFELYFEPGEEQEVKVSYTFKLGGYLTPSHGNKFGFIEYYITPAASWKDFENLTINLHLDENFPVIEESNLKFVQNGIRTYQYVSDTLPEKNLEIRIGPSFFQKLVIKLSNPYIWILIGPVAAVILGTTGIVAVVKAVKKKKKV